MQTDERENDDIDSLSRQSNSNEPTLPLNVSISSANTVVNEHSNTRRKPQKHASCKFCIS